MYWAKGEKLAQFAPSVEGSARFRTASQRWIYDGGASMRRVMAHQVAHSKTVRARMQGRSVQNPLYCARIPTNQGKNAPPTTLIPIRKPIALGTR
jgi:hypothetical protein